MADCIMWKLNSRSYSNYLAATVAVPSDFLLIPGMAAGSP